MQEESKEENNESRRVYSFRKASVKIWIQSREKKKKIKKIYEVS